MQRYSDSQLTALAIANHESQITMHQLVKREAEFTHHMACTDTGLKTCDRPAVVTLKPLVRRRERRKRRKRRRRRSGEDQDVNTGHAGP